MNSLIYLCYALIPLIGMFCLGYLFSISLSNKNDAIKIYLFFYFSFSIFLLITTAKTYFETETGNKTLIDILGSFQLFALFSSLLILAILLNKVMLVPSLLRINVLLITFTIIAYIISILEQFAFKFWMDEIYIILILTYYITIFFKYRKNVLSEKLKRFMKFVYIITIMFIPGITLDEIISPDGIKLIFVPIFYIIVGIYSAYSFTKVSNSIQNEKYIISKDLIEKYGITERETEVLEFLLKGYSYQKIADVLVISLSTVRTHVTNIYKKTSVNSRYELYNLVV